MMIGMGLFWLAIVLGVVWLVRDGVERRQSQPPSEDALKILDRRLAEGAVSLDEYRRRRDVLADTATPPAAAAGTPPSEPAAEANEG